jgi:hypothetical protein
MASLPEETERIGREGGGEYFCFDHFVRTIVTSDCGPIVIPWEV